MFNLGAPELLVLVVLALIVFGPARLPELMASVGHAIREFQRASRELTDVFQEAQQEFTQAVNINVDVATAETPATNGSYEGEYADTVPVVAADQPVVPWVSPTTAPAEYETAAAMIDPVDPYPEPPKPPEPVSATATSGEMDTAATLVDPVAPFDSPAPASDAIAASSEPVTEADADLAPTAGLTATAALTSPDAADPARPRRARRPKTDTAAVEAPEQLLTNSIAEPKPRRARAKATTATLPEETT